MGENISRVEQDSVKVVRTEFLDKLTEQILYLEPTGILHNL